MIHIVILGLSLTLVTGFISITLMMRKSHSLPWPFVRALSFPILFYNLWILFWLISIYLWTFVLPNYPGTASTYISKLLGFLGECLGFLWIYTFSVMVHELDRSPISKWMKKIITGLLAACMVVFVSGWIQFMIAGSDSIAPIIQPYLGKGMFVWVILGSSFLLYESRSMPDTNIRKSIRALSLVYVCQFILVIIFLFVSDIEHFSTEQFVPIDLAFELSYNILTVYWVTKYAGLFLEEEKRLNNLNGTIQETADKFGISKRELEIIELICKGKSNQEIADQLFISEKTVKDHNYKIFQKTGVKNRTQLAALFVTRERLRMN